jgi:hypothetical protein
VIDGTLVCGVDFPGTLRGRSQIALRLLNFGVHPGNRVLATEADIMDAVQAWELEKKRNAEAAFDTLKI